MPPRVLLAEDNESLATVLQRFLTGQGLEVVPAKNGGEAWSLLEGGGFDLLLLDLKLPVLNGVDLLRKIRECGRLAPLPVIVMSGVYKGERYAEALRRSGVRHYLEKPFTREAFMDAVREALPRPAAPAMPTRPNLLDLLIDLQDAAKSGLLSLPDGLEIAFVNGQPLSFVARGREDFPSFLAARGKIGMNDVHLFVESGEGRLFLTRAGLLTYNELAEESRLFLVKKLTEALEAKAPSTFTPDRLDTESPMVLLCLPQLLYEAITGKSSFNSGDFVSRSGQLYPARTSRFFRDINLITMTRKDIDLLAQINGSRTLSEILNGSQGGHSLFHFLLALHLIDFHPAPAPEAAPDFPLKNLFNRPLEELEEANEDEKTVDFNDLLHEVQDTVQVVVGNERMAAPLSRVEIGFEQAVQRDSSFIENKNYYEIFGLSQSTFSFQSLKSAYFEKTRQYPAEKLMELSAQTLAVAQEVLSHYANAYNTLSSVVAKERYDEMLNEGMTMGLDGKQDDELQARIQFQSGSVFLKMGEYENAEKAFQEAYTLEPDNARHTALLAWAIYRNPANKSSREVQEKARMLLGKSLKSGKTAEAFSLRGWMLLDEGRDGLAEGEFQKALKLEPRDAEARKGLKLIEDKREADKKGLFRRIFS